MNDTLNVITIPAVEEAPFASIIGQESAKKKLNFYLDSYQSTRMMPNAVLVSPKGCGKTLLAKEIGRRLIQFDLDGNPMIHPTTNKNTIKPFVEINCSSIKNVKQFINSVIVPYVADKDVTLFLDECSELPHDVSMALLTMLNPNETNRTTFSHDEYVCEFDFRRQTFLLATSEVHSVFHALLDRLTRVDLAEYSHDNLMAIVKKHTPNVNYEDGVLEKIVTVLRGNARSAVMFAKDILAYLKTSTVFMHDDWNSMRQIFSIAPLGLTAIELGVLRFLAERPDGTSLTALSAKTGMSRDALQRDTELMLQKNNLMEIQAGKGRVLTAKGLDYLKQLSSDA